MTDYKEGFTVPHHSFHPSSPSIAHRPPHQHQRIATRKTLSSSKMGDELLNQPPALFLHDVRLINKCMEGPSVDDCSFLAYASVVNIKVVGTWGDERTIAIHSPAAVPAVRTRVPGGLLALAVDLHKTVLAYLEPNWVQEGEEGEGREGEKKTCMHAWVLIYIHRYYIHTPKHTH